MDATPSDIDISETDEALLVERDVQAFHASGPGGQHQNTIKSTMRQTHEPTGVAVK